MPRSSLGGLVGTGLAALATWFGCGVLGRIAADLRRCLASRHRRISRWTPRGDSAGPRRGAADRLAQSGGGRDRRALLPAFMTEGAVADWSGVFLREVAGFGAPAGAAGFAAFSAAMVIARRLGDCDGTAARTRPGARAGGDARGVGCGAGDRGSRRRAGRVRAGRAGRWRTWRRSCSRLPAERAGCQRRRRRGGHARLWRHAARAPADRGAGGRDRAALCRRRPGRGDGDDRSGARRVVR